METPNKVPVIAISVLGGIALLGLIVAFTVGGLGNSIKSGGSQLAAISAVDFGSADSFAILAGTPSISNTGSSVITGNVGLSPATGSGITGFPPATVVGTIYTVDAGGPAGSVVNPSLLTAAKNALTAAYLNAAGQTPVSTIGSALGSTTVFAGAYDSGDTTFQITGNVTLDAQGDPNAVFIFKAGSSLTTFSSSSVTLINGANPCNVYWQVGTSATLGTNSIFRGNILALSDITLTTGAFVDGRILARNGAVVLDANIITRPSCAPPAQLHVIKTVVRVGAPAPLASEFNIHVLNNLGTDISGSPALGTSSPGTAYDMSAGNYSVTEDAFPGYAATYGGVCAPGGSFTLASGDDLTCTIINTYIPPATGGAGPAFAARIVPLIGIVKVPTPLALPAGPGSVTYDYTVWNVGGVQPLVDVSVLDDKCSSVSLISGDTNGDNKLGPTENWNYRCTTTLATTTSNTAVATGYSDDVYHDVAVATAIATVVVGLPLPPPLINIVKVPSQLTPFPFGGGNVVYTYTVTNPGVVTMHDVLVTDDKCLAVSRTSGDTNGNNLLETSETWTYTCQMNIPLTTRNIATALGQANGFTALGYAFATVLVSAPGLPNTGLPPRSR